MFNFPERWNKVHLLSWKCFVIFITFLAVMDGIDSKPLIACEGGKQFEFSNLVGSWFTVTFYEHNYFVIHVLDNCFLWNDFSPNRKYHPIRLGNENNSSVTTTLEIKNLLETRLASNKRRIDGRRCLRPFIRDRFSTSHIFRWVWIKLILF